MRHCGSRLGWSQTRLRFVTKCQSTPLRTEDKQLHARADTTTKCELGCNPKQRVASQHNRRAVTHANMIWHLTSNNTSWSKLVTGCAHLLGWYGVGHFHVSIPFQKRTSIHVWTSCAILDKTPTKAGRFAPTFESLFKQTFALSRTPIHDWVSAVLLGHTLTKADHFATAPERFFSRTVAKSRKASSCEQCMQASP